MISSIYSDIWDFLSGNILDIAGLLFLILVLISFIISFYNTRDLLPYKIFNKSFYVVAGDSFIADALTEELAQNAVVVRLTEKVLAKKKNIHYFRAILDAGFLNNINYCKFKKSIAVICAYKDDAINLNAALILKKELDSKTETCGMRKVKVLYKNLGKTQFYRFTSAEFQFFSVSELSAKYFIENYPLSKYLPLAVFEKTERIEKEKFTLSEAKAEEVKKEEQNAQTINSDDTDAGTAGGGNVLIPEPPKNTAGKGKEVIAKIQSRTVLKFKKAELPILAKSEEKVNITRIFIGFSDTNSEILEKLLVQEKLPETDLNAVVFDKNADIIMPSFYNKTNDLIDIHKLINSGAEKNSKMIALKISPESYELYEKVIRLCKSEDYCAVYIDTDNEAVNAETAAELRDWIIKENLTEKASIFVKAPSYGFTNAGYVFNEGFAEKEKIIFYGSEREIIKYLY